MTRFLLRRTAQAVLVLLLVSAIVFVLLHLLPGGAARAVLGPRATGAQIAAFDHENGLDKPVPIQFLVWLDHLVHGNLGYSYHLNQSVASLIAQRLPKTIVLNALALVIAAAVAVPIGVTQAVRRNSLFDYSATFLGFVFYSTPIFFLSLMMVLLFSLDLGWLPAQAPQGSTLAQILGQPSGLVLPVASLVLLDVALFSRYMRSAMLDNLVQDYVRTAFAKGAGRRRVVYGHVLRNSLIPMVTILGNDYPVLLGITLVVGAATVLGNLLADIGYAILDPRVRY